MLNGHWQEALPQAQETLRLDPNNALGYENVAGAYLGADRLAEGKAMHKRTEDLKLDVMGDHRDLYLVAAIEGDTAEMQRQVDWAKGKPDEFDMLQARAEVAACAGKLAEARSLYQQGIEVAQRSKNDEQAAFMMSELALTEALFGNVAQARDHAAKAVAINRSPFGSFNAGNAFATSGDQRAIQVTTDLNKRFPLNTIVNEIQIPIIHSSLELSRGNTDQGLKSLERTKPYDFGWIANVMPAYLRGQSYLGQKKPREAEVEFQKMLAHRFLCSSSVYCSLARLQLGRTYVALGDTSKARASYQDFLALWKDADSDIPVLKQAKAEYAKLQ